MTLQKYAQLEYHPDSIKVVELDHGVQMTATQIKYAWDNYKPSPEMAASIERYRDCTMELITQMNTKVEKVLLNIVLKYLCGPHGRMM